VAAIERPTIRIPFIFYLSLMVRLKDVLSCNSGFWRPFGGADGFARLVTSCILRLDFFDAASFTIFEARLFCAGASSVRGLALRDSVTNELKR
jgi:hypothetical protein